MAWLKIDDQFPDHPKVVAAGKDAGWLHICAICYCGRYLTDGFVPEAMVSRLAEGNNAELVERLLTAGLWEQDDGGYQIHDYLDYNPTAADVKAKRAANAKRQADWREGHRSDGGRYTQDSNAVTNASHNPAPSPSPSPSPSPIAAAAPELRPEPNADPVVAHLFGLLNKAAIIVNGTMQAESWTDLLDITKDKSLLSETFAEAANSGKHPTPNWCRAVLERCIRDNTRPGKWNGDGRRDEPSGKPRDGPPETVWGEDNNGNRVKLTR